MPERPLEPLRYVLVPPVEHGMAFWEITDTKTDYPVVTIQKDLPNAEGMARQIVERLNTETW